MKLLSFLGTGKRTETTYTFRGKKCTTPVIQEALCDFFSPDAVILFVTGRAYQESYPAVAERVPGCRPVDIPDGRSEKELWEIFSIVAGQVEPGDQIIFDITHGFRSLPFIAFLSSAYLKEVRKARIGAVVYGAFEAGTTIETPVFDLTPFTSILDWMGAVRSFMVHGDAGEIQNLVREIASMAYQETAGPNRPRKIQQLANQMESFSLATRMAQPVESLGIACSIVGSLPDAAGEVAEFAPPLQFILDQVEGISRLCAKGSGPEKLTPGYLRAQRNLVSYQIEKGLYMQAVTLSREWIVSLLILAKGDPESWLEENTRQAAERALTGGIMKLRREKYTPSEYSGWFESLDCFRDVVRAWDSITGIRNSLAHCGMRLKREKSMKFREKIEKIPAILESLEKAMCPARQ